MMSLEEKRAYKKEGGIFKGMYKLERENINILEQKEDKRKEERR